MKELRCDHCGKALGEHPGIGIIRDILRRKHPPRQDSLDVLHDSLEESGHEGLRRYLNYTRAHAPNFYYVRRAVQDIREGLKRPGSVPRLQWARSGPRRAYTAHGMYFIYPNTNPKEQHRGTHRLTYWPFHTEKSRVVGYANDEHELAGTAGGHHAGILRRFHEDQPYPAEGE